MSERALTLLQQARSFIRVGDNTRAADLLRRARLLAGANAEVQIAILRELIPIAGQAGFRDEAPVWREQLAALEASHASGLADAGGIPLSSHSSRKTTQRTWLWWTAGAASVAALIVAGYLLTRPTPTDPAAGSRAKTAQPAPRISQPAPRVSQSAPRVSQNDTPRPAAPVPVVMSDRESRIRDGVGLLFWVQRYEGVIDGQNLAFDYVIGNGSAFAIHESGLMLTNRHVTSARHDAQLPDFAPPAYVRMGKPVLKACFGPDPSLHFPAEILYESPNYDMAIIRVPRSFEHAFELMWERDPSMGDAIVAAGYPGAILSLSRSADPAFMENRLLEGMRTGRMSYQDQYPPDSFSPVVTRGIISSPNRSIEDAVYHLFDARIAPGNSGGPLLLEATDQVVGIVTLSGADKASGYNYALTLSQVREEIMRYLP